MFAFFGNEPQLILCIVHQNGSVYCSSSYYVYHGSMLCIHGSCASGINMGCTSGINSIAQCCESGINVAVHHAAIWLIAVHPWLNAVHQASLWHNKKLWLNAMQALIYGPMLCISITIRLTPVHIARCGCLHPWHKLCIMHPYGSIQNDSSHYTFHIIIFPLPFCYFVCG